MFRIIQDLGEYSENSIKKAIVTVLINPNFHCIMLYRIAHFLNRIHLTILSKCIWYLNRILYSVDIDYRADLAGGLVVIHGIGLVIGAYVKSKGPLRIYQGVTLGGNNHRIRSSSDMEFSQPIIESGVTIYSNSMVLGPVIIGEHAVIGAGSLILNDVSNFTITYNQRTNIEKSQLRVEL